MAESESFLKKNAVEYMAIPMFLSMKSTTSVQCSMNLNTTMPIYSRWNLDKTLFFGGGVDDDMAPNLEIYAKDILPLPQKLCSSETIWLKLFFFP